VYKPPLHRAPSFELELVRAGTELRRPGLVVAAARPTPTNRALVEAADRLGMSGTLVDADQAIASAEAGDVVLARIDVRPTLDGVDPGLGAMGMLSERGVRVLNPPPALVAAHDKLETARLLACAGLPHPTTVHVTGDVLPVLPLPVVVKPRFGSWGKDVVRCDSESELIACLHAMQRRPWYRRHGALVQALIPPQKRDLRFVVAGGEVIGAIERIPPPGEWRTNVALGATRHHVDPPEAGCSLALAAARAVGADLVGVDLLPDGEGGYVVLELNGAVEFTQDYALGAGDVFERALLAATHEPDEADDVEPDAAAPALV
jgi:[lysine-biosynthesis-protein LysW]--L-2-aminoadipate ligase